MSVNTKTTKMPQFMFYKPQEYVLFAAAERQTLKTSFFASMAPNLSRFDEKFLLNTVLKPVS